MAHAGGGRLLGRVCQSGNHQTLCRAEPGAAGRRLQRGHRLGVGVPHRDGWTQAPVRSLRGGQAALIQAIAGKLTTGTIQSAIAAPISRTSSGVQDFTTVSRRVVISLEASHPGYADRLDQATITLTLEPNARFKTWNQLATRFETIDLGKINYTQKGTLSAGLESAAPGSSEISKATLSASTERSLAEEVLLKQRYVANMGVLTPSEARIVQQGTVGVDLVGNLLFDITLVAAGNPTRVWLYQVANLNNDSGQPQPADQLRVTRRLTHAAPSIQGGWTAKLKADYRRRTVTTGVETLTESDDTVAYQIASAAAQAPVILATEEDLKVTGWLIRTPDGKRALHIQEPDAVTALIFDSFDGAREFLIWLKAGTAQQVGGRVIGLRPTSGQGDLTPLTPTQRTNLFVDTFGVNWDPSSTVSVP